MHNKKINQLYLIALSVKIALIIAAIAFTNLGIYHPTDDYLLFQNLNTEAIFKIFYNFDSGWYSVIATHGYADIPQGHLDVWNHPEQHFAFFPLYPLSVGAIMKLTGASFFASGFIFNTLILYPMIRYFYLFLIQIKLDEKIAFRIVILFLLFPFSLHYYFLYTESLFFTLLMACFYFMLLKQWWKFALASCLLTLTRPNGIFFILPFILFMLENDGGVSFKNIKKAFATPFYYIILCMPIAFFLWMVYQEHVTGNYFAFKLAQEAGWKKTFLSPFIVLFQDKGALDIFISIYCCLFMLIAALMVKKWRVSYQFMVWVNILMPLAAGSLTSMTRYLTILFPYHISAGSTTFVNKYFRYIIAMFILLQLICFKYWLEDDSMMY